MAMIETRALSCAFRQHEALRDVTLAVPEGATYALVGPNGAGKTTLLQILAGLRRASRGDAIVLGASVGALSRAQRATVSYIAEGVRMPGWMRLRELERWLAPLYPAWDHRLATRVRERFALDPSKKVGAFSRGQQMQVALLCALAPRPRVLLMDEPFTGLDVIVKDELVRGMLDAQQEHGWTVMISSHDIVELELLCDWVGMLRQGQLLLSSPMDETRERFRRVDVTTAHTPWRAAQTMPTEWIDVQVAGRRLSFVVDRARTRGDVRSILGHLPADARVDETPLSLKELFVAMAGRGRPLVSTEGVA
ncbi:MAG: ABC transporter ATP-binding protein [Gemmatimonadaceae bacterium]|jgi:ABC-2 type transport system ATP-binding protein|nr:ABC transporter ATP-binding protein [Gemmatimonadaceae bacterium]